MNQCHIILTGGIGSGKSAVARLLSDRGALVVDADAIGHELFEPEELVFSQILERWPEVVVEGRIDRRALGRIVFGDAEELLALEAMTHPAIRRRILEIVDEASPELVVVEIPMEADFLGDEWTRVVVDRLRDRGLDDDEIRGRMGAQPGRTIWIANADHVIANVGSLEDLETEVGMLLERLGCHTQPVICD